MKTLHERAMTLAKTYRSTEAELLDVLMKMQAQRGFHSLGYRNAFDYVARALKLSEAQAVYFSKVAQKAKEVPLLKKAIDEGRLTLSKARRIVPVITQETAEAWVEKAETLPQRALEKKVSEVNPQAFLKERIRPIAKARSEMRVGLSDKAESAVNRVRSLLAQKRGRVVTLEETIEAMAELYLDREDPVRKAERASSRKLSATTEPEPGNRRPLPAAARHAVHLKDRGRCAWRYPDGTRCNEDKFLHIHHRVPVSQGGINAPTNLVSLCQAHHSSWHQRSDSRQLMGSENRPHKGE